MDERTVGAMWEANAPAWTELARRGFDVYRDLVNTPAFLEMLPDVAGQCGLDIGCGEGTNTRHLAARGASMTAIDVAPTFVRATQMAEAQDPVGIRVLRASAVDLPFPDGSFDFATAIMSLMGIPELDATVREAHRVVRPGGFFQVSITHPCFTTPLWEWVRDEEGNKQGVVCGEYFAEREDIEEWTFSTIPAEERDLYRPFRVPRLPRTLSGWLNLLLDAGFAIERVGEPRADAATAARRPEVADTRIVAYFLHVRCRKPVSSLWD
ncbi:MAG: class I SAM-dependent methyltransferase [Planctomycetota bacterium]|jgi:SAM-dependent methyltransferase